VIKEILSLSKIAFLKGEEEARMSDTRSSKIVKYLNILLYSGKALCAYLLLLRWMTIT